MDVWAAVVAISIGFIIAGVALVIPNWTLLGIGLAVVVVASIVAMARGIMDRAH